MWQQGDSLFLKIGLCHIDVHRSCYTSFGILRCGADIESDNCGIRYGLLKIINAETCEAIVLCAASKDGAHHRKETYDSCHVIS